MPLKKQTIQLKSRSLPVTKDQHGCIGRDSINAERHIRVGYAFVPDQKQNLIGHANIDLIHTGR
jgi:hypothetical protein